MPAALRVYADPSVRRMLPLGFSSGLPYLLVFGTMSFRLREAGIGLATIGFLNAIPWAYALKWLWAPLVDRLPLPCLTRRLGRRRSWQLASQCVVALGLAAMAWIDPQRSLWAFVAAAVLTAFASATQDIATDAYRIESAPAERQAALAAAYQTGYRIAMIFAGAGALAIAAAAAGGDGGYRHDAWMVAYFVMAAAMAIGIATVLFSPEPITEAPSVASGGIVRHGGLAQLRAAVAGPFLDFFGRYGWLAVPILAFVSTFRISDILLAAMASPFYLDMGFTKGQVATVSSVNGVAMFLIGAISGGALVSRFGLRSVLIAGAALSPASVLLFAWLATRGNDLTALVAAVSADNLVGGAASSAFIAYLSNLTSARFTATQYALFSSLMLMLPKGIALFSGVAVERFGYAEYFAAAAALGLPALALASWAARVAERPAASQAVKK
ncbi:MAG: MFS transporter [Burkholderiaceae bacterium]|nr:MFS transporter [Burkholderiaceae bacterium]